jgi:multiple sugar transport system substrate-binding protein
MISSDRIELRGMAWDHPRGVAPLRAAAEDFRPAGGGRISVTWDARPLEQFEDTPIRDLARRYDLITIDHPLIGDACSPGPALRDLTALVPADVLTDLDDHSVGLSFASYRWDGCQYALPVDAAAQVAAFRPDLVGDEPPGTWDDLTCLAAELPPSRSIALAAGPTHLYCTWLSLCEQSAGHPLRTPDGRPDWWRRDGVDVRIGEEALSRLSTLLDLCAPESLSLNPIALLDSMSGRDQYVYTPLVFGYSSYGRTDHAGAPVRFAAPPSPDGRPAGTVLGGVGLAISIGSRHPQAAAAFAAYVASGSYQQTGYPTHGGQPAHADAWAEPGVDRLANGFFSATRDTVERSFLRPRVPGYPAFQITAGRLLHDGIRKRERPDRLMRSIAALWRDQVGRTD